MTAAGTGGQIAIVDDDENDIFLLRRLLRTAAPDCTVVPFLSSDDALGYFARVAEGAVTKPLVVFLDIKMPLRDGFEVLRAIRARPEFDTVTVCMLSGSTERADITAARHLGAECYFEKHPHVDAARELIAAAVRSATQRQKTFTSIRSSLFA